MRIDRLIALSSLLCIAVCAPGLSLRAQDLKPKPLPEIVESSGKAVGLVATIAPDGGYEEKYSCFAATPDGVLVTLYQAIADAEKIEVMLSDGRKVREVSVVAVDPRKDIAILKIEAANLPSVALGDSDRTRVGETVAMLARPLGAFPVVQDAVIAAIRDSKRGMRVHQLSGSLDRINAGAPVLNDRGETVGLVSYYRLFGANLGFVVPINYVRGLLGDKATMSFADFVKARKQIQLFDPALLEAKRLAIIEKARISSFKLRDNRVQWEFVNETLRKLRDEIEKEMNLYGATPSQVFLADSFEVAEHRQLITNLHFTFNEVFAVGEAQETLPFPLTGLLLATAPPSLFKPNDPLYGKKGESKGPTSKVRIGYNAYPYTSTFLASGGYVMAYRLAQLLAQLSSPEDMPDLALTVFYQKPGESKETVASSIFSEDAFTVRWGDIRERRIWDLRERLRLWKQQVSQDKRKNVSDQPPEISEATEKIKQ
ncbi:MAG: S1C family serine protease [Blastocatellia bacterium]